MHGQLCLLYKIISFTAKQISHLHRAGVQIFESRHWESHYYSKSQYKMERFIFPDERLTMALVKVLCLGKQHFTLRNYGSYELKY